LHKYLHNCSWHWTLNHITLRLDLSTDDVLLFGDFVFKRLAIKIIEGNLTICADGVVKFAL
jgi:glucokinase